MWKVRLLKYWKPVAGVILFLLAFLGISGRKGKTRGEKQADERADEMADRMIAAERARLRERVRHEVENRKRDLADGDVRDRAREWADAKRRAERPGPGSQG